MATIHYSNCPVCGSGAIQNVLTVRDHSVSGETFPIAECSDCTLRFTQDIPDALSIGPYYKSEDYISHTNTSRGLINRLYQAVRRQTMKSKRKLIQKITGRGKGNLLDLGSGTGSFVYEMHRHGWETTGLEPDEDARRVAKELYHIDLKELKELYNYKPGSFDAITLWHVLEHVHELHPYIDQLKSLLKKEGRLVIAIPNYISGDAAVYKEYWAAYDVPRHLYHFSPRAMKILLEKHGLELIGCKPMWFDSFYIGLLSSKYKTGKSKLISATWNGFRSNLNAIGNTELCSSVIYIIKVRGQG